MRGGRSEKRGAVAGDGCDVQDGPGGDGAGSDCQDDNLSYGPHL